MAADNDLTRLLKGVEERYNKARTLKVLFSQGYQQGSGRRVENGELLLRKPGKMRWTYANPAGKLFISDGKNVFLYSPATNRVDKIKLKEADDMRAPLAFLLGKLDFSRDFKDFEATKDGGNTIVSAMPKSDKLPYAKVNFTVSPGLGDPPPGCQRARSIRARISICGRKAESGARRQNFPISAA